MPALVPPLLFIAIAWLAVSVSISGSAMGRDPRIDQPGPDHQGSVAPRDSSSRESVVFARVVPLGSLPASDSRAGTAVVGEIDGVVLTGFSTSDPQSDMFKAYGIEQLKPGNAATAMKRQASHDLPVSKLSVPARAKVDALIKNISVYRRLPTLSFDVEPKVYAFFMQNPDVAVSTWRAMGVSEFQLTETANGVYAADAGDGSVGTIEVLYRTPEDTLIYCDGEFRSPVTPKPIQARALMRFQCSFVPGEDGVSRATHHGDVFVEFPSGTVNAISKIVAPISHAIADRNFKQVTLFVNMMSVMMNRQPAWVESLSMNMPGVSSAKKQELLDLTAECSGESGSISVTNAPMAIGIDEVLKPLIQAVAQPLPLPIPTAALSDTVRTEAVRTDSALTAAALTEPTLTEPVPPSPSAPLNDRLSPAPRLAQQTAEIPTIVPATIGPQQLPRDAIGTARPVEALSASQLSRKPAPPTANNAPRPSRPVRR